MAVLSRPGKLKAAALFACVVRLTGFKYHFKYGTSVSPTLIALLLSTKVIQYGVVDRHPVAATA